jgi:hypothetical protein
MKVGRDTDGDVRRAALLREEISADAKLMMDANQIWDVGEAIARMGQLREFDPWWIEEPTSPLPPTITARPSPRGFSGTQKLAHLARAVLIGPEPSRRRNRTSRRIIVNSRCPPDDVLAGSACEVR